MHHGLVERSHQSSKTTVLLLVTLLTLGILLGAGVGVALARAFDSANLEQRARQFSNPDASAPLVLDTLRP
jgi:membrane protein DedA with SNARE-associated domain